MISAISISARHRCSRFQSSPMAVYTISPFVGPVLGPLLSGFINQVSHEVLMNMIQVNNLSCQNTTWRWAFRATTIADAVVQLFGLFFLQESKQELCRRF